MAADVTAGYLVSDVERLRDPMNKIHKFIEDRVGKDVLDLSGKEPRVLRMEQKKKVQQLNLVAGRNELGY